MRLSTLVVVIGLLLLSSCSDGVPGRSLRVQLTAVEVAGVAPHEVVFTATVSGATGPLTYAWDFGGSASIVHTGGPTAAYTYGRVGTHLATVTVRDGAREARASVQVHVSAPAHYGDWVWVALFADGSYGGAFSVLLALDDDDSWSETSVGIWSWAESPGGIGAPYGFGLIGTLTDDIGTDLVIGFHDNRDDLKLVAVDYDGRVGTEFDGAPSVYGTGVWYFYDGSTALVDFGMKWIGDDPLFNVSSAAAPEVRALATQLGWRLGTVQRARTPDVERLGRTLSELESEVRTAQAE